MTGVLASSTFACLMKKRGLPNCQSDQLSQLIDHRIVPLNIHCQTFASTSKSAIVTALVYYKQVTFCASSDT